MLTLFSKLHLSCFFQPALNIMAFLAPLQHHKALEGLLFTLSLTYFYTNGTAAMQGAARPIENYFELCVLPKD